MWFQANITNVPAAANASGTANFTFSSSVSDEFISGGFYLGGDTPFFINRGGIKGFDNPFFTDKLSTNNIINSNGTWTVMGVIDRSILEVFLDGGDRSATNTFFPQEPLDTMTFGTEELNAGVQVTLTVRSLKSTWQSQENVNGTVVGNATMPGR